jgi:hypothetical protein
VAGIVLHRYFEFYVITPMTDSEIQAMARPIIRSMTEYLESKRSAPDVRNKLQIPDFTWESMMDQLVSFDPPNKIDLQEFGLSVSAVKSMSLEQIFSYLIRDAHVQSTIRTAKIKIPNLKPVHYDSFEQWAVDAKARANFLKDTVEKAGVSWIVALKQLHELAGDPTKLLKFQQWLTKVLKGSHQYQSVYQQFVMYTFDWQMANFFQYDYNPKKVRRRVATPNPDWSPLEMLPINRLERRRLFFEDAKSAGSFIAFDFRGLGLSNVWSKTAGYKQELGLKM